MESPPSRHLEHTEGTKHLELTGIEVTESVSMPEKKNDVESFVVQSPNISEERVDNESGNLSCSEDAAQRGDKLIDKFGNVSMTVIKSQDAMIHSIEHRRKYRALARNGFFIGSLTVGVENFSLGAMKNLWHALTRCRMINVFTMINVFFHSVWKALSKCGSSLLSS